MRLRLGFMLVCVLATTAAGCASAGGPSPDGMRPRETSETRDAESALNLAMIAGPEQGNENYETALSAALAAITADSVNPLAYKLAGQALIGLDRLDEAAEMLDMAEELRPAYFAEETEAIREGAWIDQYQRAQPMMDAGDYLGAAEVLEGANTIYQQRPEIMVVLGQIYVQEGQPDRAITYLRRADSVIEARAEQVDSAMIAEWRITQADIPVQVAQALLSAERYDEAAEELQGLVAQNPDNTLYANNLASIYIQTDQPDLAVDVYEELLERSDLAPSDYYSIGVGFYNIARYDDAADIFEQGVNTAERDRDSVEMWARSIQMYHTQDTTRMTPESLQEIIGVLERWVELDPNSQAGNLILAQAFNNMGDDDRTVEVIERMEGMTIQVIDLTLRRNPSGGATVVGTVENRNGTPGSQVAMQFTFYDAAGNAIGSQTQQVMLVGPQATQTTAGGRTPIEVVFSSDQQVDGYSYETP